jgi:hypothetical protein
VPDTGNAEVPDTGKPATGEIEKDEASIAVESGPGSDSRHEAHVAPNKNTPGGAVAVAVVESAQASDSASILAGAIVPKLDSEVPDTGNAEVPDTGKPATGEIEKGEAESVMVESCDADTKQKMGGTMPTQFTITIDDDSESESETEMVRFVFLCLCACVSMARCALSID